jgi:hypothetical protein
MAEMTLQDVRDLIASQGLVSHSRLCQIKAAVDCIDAHLANHPAVDVKGEAVALDYTPGLLDKTAPDRIWLQIDTGGDRDDREESWIAGMDDGVSWCADSIGGLEIQYVRADLASPQHASVVIDDAMILKTARHLCQKSSYICNVNEEDNWKLYSEEFCSEAFMTLHVALGGGV